jgi:hypothetical protein
LKHRDRVRQLRFAYNAGDETVPSIPRFEISQVILF